MSGVVFIGKVFTVLAAFFAGHFTVAPVLNYSAITILPVPPAKAVVLFGGDMMFDRSIRIAADTNGDDFIFSCVDDVLKAPDLVVANLEGPITSHASVSASSHVADANNFTFTFPTTTAPLLLRHNIRIVNLGNNHIENFSQAGVRSTMDALTDAGVSYFGDTLTQSVATTSVKGISFAFINYNQFAVSSTKELTVQQIQAARMAGEIPVVYTHWGEEYVPATALEKSLAHAFIDAGAEIVIGSHPHVIQESEIYHGKHIYYSLGNLIFDQYWNNAVRNGLLVSVTFDQSGVTAVSESRVELERDRRTCPTATTTPAVE